MLSVQNLGCVAGEKTLIKHLSFDLAPGQFLQLRGANGIGKTTLLRCLAGLGRPEEGTVLWQGEAINQQRLVWNSAMLMQGHSTGWRQHLTVLENLASQAQIDQAPSDQTSLDQAMARCGLQRQANLPVMRLSAGQKRRLSLARLHLALQHKQVWLLDEPATALDTAGQQLLGELFAQHCLANGLIVAATHQSLVLEAGLPITELELKAPARPSP
jgi:heme exporter protein A